MGKPTICLGENKGADQLRVIAKLISAFVFATQIVQFLFYLNRKFQASSSFLCLYRPVCVGPVRKPHCWFSHEAAHILKGIMMRMNCNDIDFKLIGTLKPICILRFGLDLHLISARDIMCKYLKPFS